MESNSLEAKILLQMPNINVFRLIQNERSKLVEGTLKIGYLEESNAYFMNVETFNYNIPDNVQSLVSEFETQRIFIFPHVQQGFVAIVVPLADGAMDQLMTIFQNIVQFTQPVGNQQLEEQIKTHCQNIFTVPLVPDSKINHYISLGGNYLSKGFSWLGGVMSKGVNYAGSFINSKISDNNEQKEVSLETKQKFEKIKATTKDTMKVTGDFLSQLLSPVAKLTSKFIDDTSKKIDDGDNQHLKKIKEVGKVTTSALTTAFTGLSQGAQEVGSSLSKNTRDIVEKKYGSDVSTTFLGKADEQDQQQEQEKQQQKSEQNSKMNENSNKNQEIKGESVDQSAQNLDGSQEKFI